jgi:two-component system response regulator YesN
MYKVFIADDESLCREYLQNKILWENYGFHVCGQAENGVEALRLITKLEPNVVFLDINMPKMDGISLAENIKKMNPAVCIIFISGYSEFEYARKALKMGAEDYILKPFSQAELLETVEKTKKKLDEAFGKPAASKTGFVLPVNNGTKGGNKKTKAAIHLDDAIAYIKKEYSDPDLTIDAIARELYITPVYLRKIFHHYLGISVIDFIINNRLYRARELIEQNKENIKLSEIALTVGYRDSGYFSRYFKKKFGLSPSEYENMMR